jgi:hypothetical protein
VLDPDDLLNRYIVSGGTPSMVVVDMSRRPDVDVRGLPPYRRIEAECQDVALDRVGSFMTEKGYRPGPVASPQSALNDAVAYLFAEFGRLASSVHRGGALFELIRYNERLIAEQARQRMSLPSRLLDETAREATTASLLDRMPEFATAALASRFAIEYVAVVPPNGLRPFSASWLGELLAVGSHIISFGWDSDLIHHHLADLEVRMLGSGRLGIQRRRWTEAQQSFLRLVVEADVAVALGAEPHSSLSSSERTTELDRAAAHEFGVTFSQLADVIACITVLGSRQETDPRIALRTDLERDLVERLGWERSQIEAALRVLVLERRADFLSPPRPFARADVYPWRFNRRLSYLSKPIVTWVDPDGAEYLVWGSRHIVHAYENLMALCLTGRYRATSPQLTRLIGMQRDAYGKGFARRVADVASRASGVLVRTEIDRVGGLRLERSRGQSIGDVDVLVVDRYHRVVWAIEAKSLAVARTPTELANEVGEILKSSSGDSASAEIHMERVEWLRRHRRELLADVGLASEKAGRWQVRALIVTETELLSPHVVSAAIPVISLRRLAVAVTGSRRGLEIRY